MTLNGKVVQESFPYGDTTIIMYFTYDEQGRPFSLLYSKNGGSSFDAYYYAINAQGDVEGIFFTRKNTETGKQEVRWMGYYTYDAWGNITSITGPGSTLGVPGDAVTNPANLMLRNPLRYRGYYYDSETGFYYLQSRYYDPVNRRFINADAFASTGQGFLGYNMFAYCNNNAVSFVDTEGYDTEYVIGEEKTEKIVGRVKVTIKVTLKCKSRVYKEIDVTITEDLENSSVTFQFGPNDRCSVELDYNSLVNREYSNTIELDDNISFTADNDGVGFIAKIPYGVYTAEIQITFMQLPSPIGSSPGTISTTGQGFGGVAGVGYGQGVNSAYCRSGGCYTDSCGLGGGGMFGNTLRCLILR